MWCEEPSLLVAWRYIDLKRWYIVCVERRASHVRGGVEMQPRRAIDAYEAVLDLVIDKLDNIGQSCLIVILFDTIIDQSQRV